MNCGGRLPLLDRERLAARKDAASRLLPQFVRFIQFERVLTTDGTGIFNAKAQSREGAKTLCVSAPLRLCVEMSFISVKSVKSVVHFLCFQPSCRLAPNLRRFEAGRTVAGHQFNPKTKVNEGQNKG